MGIWSTIGEAAATMNDDKDAAARFHQQKTDKHAALETNTHTILDDVKRLQERRASLPPGSPELAEIDKSLADHQKAFSDLYHPTKNPGAFQHLGRFLEKHVAKKEPAPLPASNAVTPERLGQLQMGADKVTSGDPYLTPADMKKKARVAAGLDPRATAEKPERYQPQLTETTDAEGKKHYWRVPLESGEKPEEVDFQGQAVTPKGKPGGTSKFSQEAAVYEKKWGKKLADWTPEELTYFNQKLAYDAQRSGQSTTTRLEKDQDGNIHPVEITNTRGPMKPPLDPHATPLTPSAAKQKMGAVAPPSAPKSNVKEGAPLSFKAPTPAVTSAQKDVKDAVALSSQADQVAQHPNDAINQKRLAVALERVSAGRFTTQALEYIIKAGWGNTMEQWANNPSTGALPADVMRQLVDGAHQNLKAKQDALKAAEGGGAGDDDEFLKKF